MTASAAAVEMLGMMVVVEHHDADAPARAARAAVRVKAILIISLRYFAFQLLFDSWFEI